LLVITAQLRQKMGAMPFEDPYILSSGGMAAQFYASVVIRLKSGAKIKGQVGGVDEIVGVKSIAHIYKNRIGPPFKKIPLGMYYDSGIDNYGGWL